MPVIMPNTLDLPSYTYRAPVEGVTYQWRYRWLTRPGAWYLDLATDAGEPIRRGVKLVPGWRLLWRLRHPARPPGDLFLAGPQTPPTLESLGRTHILYYLTTADIAEFATPPPPSEAVTIEVVP
jgi:hypothetical protein